MATNSRIVINDSNIPSAKEFNFGIVVSEWNPEITNALYEGAYSTLISHDALPNNITVKHVPGSFELTIGSQFMAEYTDVDVVICLGCIIQGETPHFDYICQSVSHGITQLNIEYNIPFIFGILTTNNYEQASERAGGKLGNKGEEAAIVAIKMAALQRQMEK